MDRNSFGYPTVLVHVLPLALGIVSSSAWGVDRYVAVGGTGPGTMSSPFGRIQDAADVAMPADVIHVAPGIYREEVKIRRSGTAGAPIVFQSDTPGAAVISGADLIGPFTQQASSSIWSASMADFATKSTEGQGDQCFIGDERLMEARWPHTPTGAMSSPAFATVMQAVDQSAAPLPGPQVAYKPHIAVISNAANNRLPNIDWTGATIRLLPVHGYQMVTGEVLASTPTSLVITYPVRQPEPPYNIVGKGSQYFLYGVPAVLTQAGTWTRSGADLLVRAPGDVNPNTLPIECKQRDFAFDLTGQSYVHVAGFKIRAASVTTDNVSDTAPPDPYVAPANHVVLDQLTVESPNSIRDLSKDPFKQWTNHSGIVLSGTQNVLQNSTIRHADGNGVSVIGVDNKVLRNRITDSNLSGCECSGIAAGYWTTVSRNHEIAYNSLARSGRSLILLSALREVAPGQARIHHNLLEGSLLQTRDNGAIYTYQNNPGTPGDQAGVEIDHNRISAATVGVYLDNCSKGLIVHHNLAVTAGEPGLSNDNNAAMIINGATNHLIANNTFIALAPTVRAIVDTFNNPPAGCNRLDVVIRNNVLRRDIYRGEDPSIATVDHNLQWDGIAGSVTDPRLQNLAADDLRLQTGSPAIDAGIAIAGVTNHPDAQTGVGNPDQGAFEFGQPTWLPDASGDHVAPSVILTTPAEGDVYVVGEQVKASYHCVDDESGSGIARCTGSLQNRAVLDTATAGSKTFSVTAVDHASNVTTSATRHYSVVNVCSSLGCF